MFSFTAVPKFVINLDHRQDRLEKTAQEFRKLGWEFERFGAIRSGAGVIGCMKSHVAVANIALERNYPYVLICEDDNIFMPWATEMISQLDSELNAVSWSCCQLSPIPYRPIVKYASPLLMDLTYPTESDEDAILKDCPSFIAGASCYLLNREVCQVVVDRFAKYGYEMPLDMVYSHYIYPKYQTVCPLRPLCLQSNDTSDNERGTFQAMSDKQRMMWNSFCPTKI